MSSLFRSSSAMRTVRFALRTASAWYCCAAVLGTCSLGCSRSSLRRPPWSRLRSSSFLLGSCFPPVGLSVSSILPLLSLVPLSVFGPSCLSLFRFLLSSFLSPLFSLSFPADFASVVPRVSKFSHPGPLPDLRLSTSCPSVVRSGSCRISIAPSLSSSHDSSVSFTLTVPLVCHV